MVMLTGSPRKADTSWEGEVSVTPIQGTNTQAQMKILDFVRQGLPSRLQQNPDQHEHCWETPFYRIQVKHRSGCWKPGTPLKLNFKEELGWPQKAATGTAASSELPCLLLPDDRIHALGQRLVGVEPVIAAMLLDWQCRWDGASERWSNKTGCVLPSIFRAHRELSTCLYLLHGDPGTGKTISAQVMADRYCRWAGIAGRLIILQADVRGDGTVGNFSARLRAAFSALASLPSTELRVLLVDEGEAVAMARSEHQAHHEDRVGTSSVIQELDRLRGELRLAVILTSNVPDRVDAAVRRRAVLFSFSRPGPQAREAMLRQWLPEVDPKTLHRAVKASQGMTPADLDKALHQAYLAAIALGTALLPATVIDCLRRSERTRGV